MRVRYGFDEAEWNALQAAVATAVAYVTKAETGRHNPPREIAASAGYLSNQMFDGPTPLVRGLSGSTVTHDSKWPGYTSKQLEPVVMETLGHATALVADRRPDELAAFRALVVNTARASVCASTGTEDPHTPSLDVIERALR